MPHSFLLLAESGPLSPYQLGRSAGASIILLLIIFGIYRMILAMKRTGTSKLCALSLLCIFTGWLIASVVSLVQSYVPNLPPILSVLASLVSVLLTLTAAVLGIAGLATYDRSRHIQGRAYAIWSIVIGFAVFAGIIFAFTRGFKEGSDRQTLISPQDSRECCWKSRI